MPHSLSPIRKALLKKALKKNKGNIKQSMLDAGYKLSTADRSIMNKSAQICQAEIVAELKHSDITPDLIIKHFEEDRTLALAKKDYATATRVDELMGKSIAMLTDRQDVTQTIVVKQDEKDELSRLRGKLLTISN